MKSENAKHGHNQPRPAGGVAEPVVFGAVTAAWLLPPLGYSVITGEPSALVVMCVVYVFGGLLGFDKFLRSSEDSSQTSTTGCFPPQTETTNVYKFKKAT